MPCGAACCATATVTHARPLPILTRPRQVFRAVRRCLLRNGYSGKDPQQLASLLLLSRAQLIKLVQVRRLSHATKPLTAIHVCRHPASCNSRA